VIMPHILDEIMYHKREETERLMAECPCEEMHARMADAPAPRNLIEALRGDTVSVIAEIKRSSPSEGVIREGHFDPAAIAAEYEAGGASALSVLTDERYFGGHIDYLSAAHEACELPVLCKDFIHRRYQLYRARAAGADAVLLIVSVLEPTELMMLIDGAREVGLTPLVETHNFHELALAVGAGATLIGVNNRDLTTFEVDLSTTEGIARSVFPDRTLVGESGIHTRADVERLAAVGVDAVLVGTTLMRADSPREVLRELTGVPRRERGVPVDSD